LCGDDPAVEGDTWGTGDTHYGDRVGGEGGGDCQGRRPPAQTTVIKHVSVIRVTCPPPSSPPPRVGEDKGGGNNTDTEDGHGHDVYKDSIDGNNIKH